MERIGGAVFSGIAPQLRPDPDRAVGDGKSAPRRMALHDPAVGGADLLGRMVFLEAAAVCPAVVDGASDGTFVLHG